MQSENISTHSITDQSVHSVEERIEIDLKSFEATRTVLHDCNYQLPALTYGHVDWKLLVRKQVQKIKKYSKNVMLSETDVEFENCLVNM